MILVTGSAGLLGSHLLYDLVKEGETPRALIRSEESKNKILEVFLYYTNDAAQFLKKIQWVYGDVLDKTSLVEAFDGITHVYHCAAFVSFSNKQKQKIYDVNIRGTAAVVDLCLLNSVKKLVHVSSIAAIKSETNDKVLNEKCGWPQGTSSPYSYSKTQSEFEVWRGIEEGLNAVIVNPSVILGPGNWSSGSSLFYARVNNGMKYYTAGSTGFVDVRDVSKVMTLLMKSEIHSNRFILNSANLSYKTLFSMIAKQLNCKAPNKMASSWLTEIAWRLEKSRSLLFFSEPQLTKHSARAAQRTQKYSSDKLTEELNFSYKPIEETIKHACKLFLRYNE